jgi:hypothetical protein
MYAHMNKKEVEPMGSFRLYGDMSFKGILRTWPLLVLFSLLPGYHAVSSFSALLSHHYLLPRHEPKSNGATNHGLEPPKFETK